MKTPEDSERKIRIHVERTVDQSERVRERKSHNLDLFVSAVIVVALVVVVAFGFYKIMTHFASVAACTVLIVALVIVWWLRRRKSG